ncbi:rad17 checkpoint clamp loader component isoform X2 [Dermacentor variabilis]|uniref:rad17 checkpoint clamp loader component isoform X2 n=1 Tax=Dermacentor variabilis TaxID=34621 RepID=UPI003F5B7DDC
MSWVKPDDGFCLEPPKNQSAHKRMTRKRPAPKDDCSAACDLASSGHDPVNSLARASGTWVEKFAPKSRNDLAVHRDKVEQVCQCIKEKLKTSFMNAGAIILLCGPAGSGKTATLRCLAAEEGFTICEWINPVSLTAKTEFNPNWDFGRSTGQVEQFEDFLFQSSRYPSLLTGDSAKRVVLVEDLPNIFIRDVESLHRVLRMCRAVAVAPLVFIISESSDKLEHRLFPEALMKELDVAKIMFNSIAPTFVTKALCTLLDTAVQLQAITHEPTADDIDSIVAASNGDIRSAINALEFFCSPRQWDGTEVSTCDLSLSSVKDSEKCPTTDISPEEVFERAAVSAETFSLFLHHNMPDFAADIHTVAQCSEWFCHGDVLLSEWTSENVMERHAMSVVTRGVISSLSQSGSKSVGWRPLGKPQWSAAFRDIKQKLYDLRVAFKGLHSTGRELQLDRVPYLALLQESGLQLSNTRRVLVEEIGTLANRNLFHRSNLREQDTMDDREVELSVNYSCRNVEVVLDDLDHSDEEVIIEEYDD